MTDNKKSQNVADQFACEKCHYICSNKFDYNKHLLTRKHLKDKTDNKKSQNVANEFKCKNCGNIYKYQSGLCKHTKTCNPPLAQPSEIDTLTKLVMELVKNSTEVQTQLIELCKAGMHNTNNTINNNQKFNIHMYLNEECKDAMNFSDFIKNIVVSREDLENNARLGFVDGFSKILIDNLNKMTVTKRPIHCTDVKRETMYIKDDDKWNKEEDSTKINKVIQEVTRKSLRTVQLSLLNPTRLESREPR